ncbi:MAG: lmo0937 family membrane protein [Acidithiobacillus ferrivorans]
MGNLLWTIIVVLFVLWLLGFALHFGGGLISILLVIAIILVVVNLLSGRRTRL